MHKCVTAAVLCVRMMLNVFANPLISEAAGTPESGFNFQIVCMQFGRVYAA